MGFERLRSFLWSMRALRYRWQFFYHFSCCIFVLPQRNYNGNGLQKANCSRKGLDLK